jgi:hypothetical protein
MYKEFLEAQSDAVALGGGLCGLMLFQAPMILLFGVGTENRSLEELVPDTGMRDIIESKVGAGGYEGSS